MIKKANREYNAIFICSNCNKETELSDKGFKKILNKGIHPLRIKCSCGYYCGGSKIRFKGQYDQKD